MLHVEFSKNPERYYGTKGITYNFGDEVEIMGIKFTIPEEFSISESMTLDEKTGDIICSLKIDNKKFNFVSECSHGLQNDRRKLWEIVFHGIENYNGENQ